MSETVLTVENLSKRYIISHHRSQNDGLRHVVEAAVRAPFRRFRSDCEQAPTSNEEFWALKDVAFSVTQGEAVGIVGRNGAGKSTLLKLLSRITEPTTGQIRYKGRVSSLLEVGTGFHPDLTGRENIFLNAAILGMRRSDIARKFDEIVAFAEVEKFLDTPVKRYSSGMYVRLAFGVAAHLEPEILLVDEVLAVGDATFQKKCLGKMGTVVSEGRTVLFVSHNMAAINSLCTRAILIDGGHLKLSGSPQSVIEEYLSKARSDASIPLSERNDRRGSGRMRFTELSVLNERNENIETVISGQDISISLGYNIPASETLYNVAIQIKFFGAFGQQLFACSSRAVLSEPFTLAPGSRVFCYIPRLPLRAGIYTFSIWCTVSETLEDYVSEAGKLTVVEGDFFGTGKFPARNTGDFLVAHRWSVDGKVHCSQMPGGNDTECGPQILGANNGSEL